MTTTYFPRTQPADYYPAPDRSSAALPERSGATAIQGRFGNHVDQGRFWVGAVLTAAVAGLAAIIGMVMATDLLRVPIHLTSVGMAGSQIATYGLAAAVIALLAATAYNGMLAFAPRPTVYYSSIMALLTALAVLLPFTAAMTIPAQLALAGINLVIGILITYLVPVAASSARSDR